MVNPDERSFHRPGCPFRPCDTHKQGADQPWPGSDGKEIDLSQADASAGESIIHHTIKDPQMFA
jgi:hypothetical protein